MSIGIDTYREAEGAVADIGGILYFAGDDGAGNGEELWRSDGTEAGTYLVKDIQPGPAGSAPRKLVGFKGGLCFSADDGTHGREPWWSDGTAQGTALVKDIWPGGEDSVPESFVALGGSLLFAAEEEEHGRELWKTDGTEGGTELVKDVREGWLSGLMGKEWYGARLVAMGGMVFFKALGDLYRSDGTEAGTVALDSAQGVVDEPIAATDSAVFFTSNLENELWVSDGTVGGATLVHAFDNGKSVASINDLTPMGNTLFLVATDNTHGRELWRTDGTPVGTVCLEPCAGAGCCGNPTSLTVLDGTLYFTAGDDEHGREMWQTEGTLESMGMVKDIWPGSGSPWILSVPGAEYTEPWFTAAAGACFFRADDGEHGMELWTSDGTAAGTRMVADLRVGSDDAEVHSLIAIGDTLFFSGRDGTYSYGLWTPRRFMGTATTTGCLTGSRQARGRTWTPRTRAPTPRTPIRTATDCSMATNWPTSIRTFPVIRTPSIPWTPTRAVMGFPMRPMGCPMGRMTTTATA